MERTLVEVDSTAKQLASVASVRAKELRRLVDLVREQRDILLQGRVAELSDNVQAQERILADLARLEKREDELKSSLGADSGAVESAPSYLEVAAADRDSAESAEMLRPLVRGNTELLENAMQYVTFSLGILSSLTSEPQPYSPGSESAPNGQAIMLDLKA